METLRVQGHLGLNNFGDINLDDPIAEGAEKLDQEVGMAILDSRFDPLASRQITPGTDTIYIESVLYKAIEQLQQLQEFTGAPAEEQVERIDQIVVQSEFSDPRFFRFFVAVTSRAEYETPVLTGLLSTLEVGR